MQLSPQTLQELHKGDRFGFDDRFHHQLPGAIQNGNRDRFFVNVEPISLGLELLRARGRSPKRIGRKAARRKKFTNRFLAAKRYVGDGCREASIFFQAVQQLTHAWPLSTNRERTMPPGTISAQFLFFHNSIHRYFIVAPRIALTSIKQLFSLCRVDG
jgi:hypothetical protein